VRLAIVGPAHPLRGGIALHTAEMASAAAARGHDVEVVSYRRLYPRLLFPGRTQLDPAPPERRPFRSRALIDSLAPWSWREAARAIAGLGPALVVLQRWHPFFAPALASVAGAARRSGTRVVWMMHNVAPHEQSGRILRPLYAHGIWPEDICLTHAGTVARELACLRPGTRVEVIRHPAPASLAAREDPAAARHALGVDPDAVLFLFLGYVRRYKGVDVLLDALARLVPEGRPWRAIVAGEWYIDRSGADQAIARPPLQGKVVLEDRFLADHELARYLAAATVVVAPYRDGTQSGIVPLAYAHGRAVIVGNVGGLPEVVEPGRTGLLVPPADVGALADALEEVRQGRQFSPEAIAEAHARSSWRPFIEKLEEIAALASRRAC